MKIIKLTKCPRCETLRKVKIAKFHPKAKDIISSFPLEVKRVLGKAIFDIQKGASYFGFSRISKKDAENTK